MLFDPETERGTDTAFTNPRARLYQRQKGFMILHLAGGTPAVRIAGVPPALKNHKTKRLLVLHAEQPTSKQ